ncbi:MAG TPA: hypothetical protein VGN12_22460 [Pirellulales bacterium]|jgi:hypothetical protein
MAKVLLRAFCVLLVALSVHVARPQSMQVNPTGPYVQVTLKEQLQKGLKCRRPLEFRFVDHVVHLVDKGKLPLDLVNICFDWSRQRSNHIPFVYFQRSLIMLAAQEGITLKMEN